MKFTQHDGASRGYLQSRSHCNLLPSGGETAPQVAKLWYSLLCVRNDLHFSVRCSLKKRNLKNVCNVQFNHLMSPFLTSFVSDRSYYTSEKIGRVLWQKLWGQRDEKGHQTWHSETLACKKEKTWSQVKIRCCIKLFSALTGSGRSKRRCNVI